MDTLSLWNVLEEYKSSGSRRIKAGSPLDNKIKILTVKQEYFAIRNQVSTKMYDVNGGVTSPDGESIFNNDDFGIGSDDGHDDLVDFIIYNGKESVDNFLTNPKSALPIAKKMTKHPGFSGDTNDLRRIFE